MGWHGLHAGLFALCQIYLKVKINSLVQKINGDIMKEFLTAATSSTGGASLVGAATGQLYIAGATFICFLLFGVWGAYWKYRDSKAIQEALNDGDLNKALRIRGR